MPDSVSTASTAPTAPAPLVGGAAGPIPVRSILPWALLAGALLLMVVYFVGSEQGAFSVFGGTWMHEFVHDGRHLLGFPCH